MSIATIVFSLSGENYKSNMANRKEINQASLIAAMAEVLTDILGEDDAGRILCLKLRSKGEMHWHHAELLPPKTANLNMAAGEMEGAKEELKRVGAPIPGDFVPAAWTENLTAAQVTAHNNLAAALIDDVGNNAPHSLMNKAYYVGLVTNAYDNQGREAPREFSKWNTFYANAEG